MKFYRYVDYSFNESECNIHLEVWVSVKETDCYYHIIPEYTQVWEREYARTRKVSKENLGRSYAQQTEEDAMNSFKVRKQRQIQHCNNSIKRAELALLKASGGELPKPVAFTLI